MLQDKWRGPNDQWKVNVVIFCQLAGN